MMPVSDTHDQEYPKLVLLYALHALPASEVSVVGAHIAACQGCRQELETLRPIIGSLAARSTDILRPSASLWDRLARQIAEETGRETVKLSQPRSGEPEWLKVGAGISCQLLGIDTEKRRVTMLVRLAPGAEYPPHRHAGLEELHMLHGELMVDGRKFLPGDYLRSEAGSADRRVWSETGCTGILITSLDDALI